MKQYNVYELTMEQLIELIALGDDSIRNQIRIKEDGTIFLSSIVGNNCLTGIAGRFETFDANNGYVGRKAATNEQHIQSIYLAIKRWIDHPVPYIDYWIHV